MKIEMRPTNSVKPYDRNPRDNDAAVEAVARSIKAFGFRQPIVVDAEGVIVVGHTRHRAALLLELAEVPVHVATDLSPAKLKAYRIADNKTGELATWDEDMLASEIVDLRELAELPDAEVDLDALGFEDGEIAELLGEDTKGETDPDAVPATPEEPTAKVGDLWILGEHRILCGDSTKEDDVARLMDGATASLTMTSPPYWVGKEYEREKSWDEVLSFIDNVSAIMASATVDNGRIVVNTGTADTRLLRGVCERTLVLDEWQKCLRRHGWLLRHARIWAKNGMVLAGPASDVVDMHWEFIGTFYKPHKPFVGQRRVDDSSWPNQGIWENIKGNANQEGHCASYPIEIPSRNIQLYSDNGDVVYEPFAGAGTTIIAAEQLGRRCFAIEIEPRYVDVCVKRWEQFTGREARLATVDDPRSGS